MVREERFIVGLDLDWVIFFCYFFLMPGVKTFFRKLREENCEIVIVTSRRNFILTLGKWCLRLWGLGHVPIFGVKEKNGSKALLLKELKAKVFIDNTLTKLESIVKDVPHPLWFDWLVGNHRTIARVRVGDWGGILDFIKMIV